VTQRHPVQQTLACFRKIVHQLVDMEHMDVDLVGNDPSRFEIMEDANR
jgi:hypothetical protein